MDKTYLSEQLWILLLTILTIIFIGISSFGAWNNLEEIFSILFNQLIF